MSVCVCAAPPLCAPTLSSPKQTLTVTGELTGCTLDSSTRISLTWGGRRETEVGGWVGGCVEQLDRSPPPRATPPPPPPPPPTIHSPSRTASSAHPPPDARTCAGAQSRRPGRAAPWQCVGERKRKQKPGHQTGDCPRVWIRRWASRSRTRRVERRRQGGGERWRIGSERAMGASRVRGARVPPARADGGCVWGRGVQAQGQRLRPEPGRLAGREAVFSFAEWSPLCNACWHSPFFRRHRSSPAHAAPPTTRRTLTRPTRAFTHRHVAPVEGHPSPRGGGRDPARRAAAPCGGAPPPPPPPSRRGGQHGDGVCVEGYAEAR